MTTAGFARDRPPSQDVMNERWPAPAVARVLQPFDSQYQQAVDVRVVWKVDGEEWVPAIALVWTPSDRDTPPDHVKVWCGDPRLIVPYIWLRPADVRPRSTSAKPQDLPQQGLELDPSAEDLAV